MGKPEEDIEVRKRINLNHLAYLESFIDAYLKSSNKKQFLTGLQRYREWPDIDIKNIANKLFLIHQEYLNYTYPKEVPLAARQEVTDLIKEAKKKNAPAPAAPAVAVPATKPAPVLISTSTSAPKQELDPDTKGRIENKYRVAKVASLDNIIAKVQAEIKKLEKSDTRVTKTLLKKMRAKALFSIRGKKHQHLSKLDVARELLKELQNVKKASENTAPVLSAEAISDKIQHVVTNISKLEKTRKELGGNKSISYEGLLADVSTSFQLDSKKMANDAFNKLKQVVNSKFNGEALFRSSIDDLKSTPKFNKDHMYMEKPPPEYKGRRTNAYEKLGAADFMALFYPLASDERDQLVIDSVGKAMLDKKEHPSYPYYELICELNKLKQLPENILECIQKGKNVQDYVDLNLGQIDEAMQNIQKLAERTQDKEVKQIIKGLESFKTTVINQLPDEYKPKSAPELS